MSYDEDYGKELYTFADFCADRDILPIDSHYKEYPVMWDIYGEDYLAFCKENDYDYEDLDEVTR